MKTDNLEKRDDIRVMIANRCRVFQCSVNWARARPKTALIAMGAGESSRISSVLVRDGHWSEYEFSINSVPVYLCQP